MRIDPEAVYLEISEATTTYNITQGTTDVKPSAVIHWKDGNRWRRVSFIGSEHNGETLGQILGRVGEWIDANGLAHALEQGTRLKGATP